MFSQLEHSHEIMDKLHHNKMSKIYIFQAFKTFVVSMLGIFVPVYLYKIGYSIIEILIYVGAISLTILIFLPILMMIINKLGFKNTILLSIPIYFLHILSLNFIEGSYLFFNIAWFTYGIQLATFWIPMHSEIAVNGDSKKRGSQMGTLQIITTIFAMLGPFIGGFVLEIYGYNYLLILATCFLILGSILFIFSKDIKINHFDFEYKNFVELIKDKSGKWSGEKKSFFCRRDRSNFKC